MKGWCEEWLVRTRIRALSNYLVVSFALETVRMAVCIGDRTIKILMADNTVNGMIPIIIHMNAMAVFPRKVNL